MAQMFFFPALSPDAVCNEQKSNKFANHCSADGRRGRRKQVCRGVEATQSKCLLSVSHKDESTWLEKPTGPFSNSTDADADVCMCVCRPWYIKMQHKACLTFPFCFIPNIRPCVINFHIRQRFWWQYCMASEYNTSLIGKHGRYETLKQLAWSLKLCPESHTSATILKCCTL